MKNFNPLHNVADTVADLPGFKGYFERQYERKFTGNRDENLFRGVFDTFDAALKSAPPTRPLGYDNADAASMYIERTRRIYPTDYPVMFWLQRVFSEGANSIFDLGGHIGVSYYAYRRYLTYPTALKWAVHDVPAVMEAGARLAETRDQERQLGFAKDFVAVEGADVLFALGSPQYLPEPLYERLGKLKNIPQHVILNLIPLHQKKSYFTLQSIGTAFCPYRITSVGEFLKGFDALGYKLINHWENPDKSCEIPFYPEFTLDHYNGFYFRRETR
jgi:putative methyltransferase (TIGR04325 family)